MPDICLFLNPIIYKSIFFCVRSYDHAVDLETGSVDEVYGRHQVFFGAPKACQAALSRQACAEVLLRYAGGRAVKHALGSVGLYHTGSFRYVTAGVRTIGHALGSVGLYHMGSFRCVTDPGVCMWARRRQCLFLVPVW